MPLDQRKYTLKNKKNGLMDRQMIKYSTMCIVESRWWAHTGAKYIMVSTFLDI